MDRNATVSPVIGSILMIVLTLIVAAIVGSFTGGIVETKGKLPSVRLEVEFSQTGNLSMVHTAGDPIPLSQISLQLTPSQTFGSDAIKHSRTIDKTKFQDKMGVPWGDIAVMQVGDRHHIAQVDIAVLDAGETDVHYKVTDSTNIGRTFYLEIYYENTLIAKPEVLIKA
jgi:FlaG/FlaF family flagellin (archaellin)